MSRLRILAITLLAAAGVAHLGMLAYVFAHRIGYPLDLEWMEGGTLTHALRLMEGRGIYVEPSVDFISFLYMPLYPLVLAALGQIVGLSYALGRALSILCFGAAMAIAIRAVRREGGAWPFAFASAGAIAAAFPLVDGFYDLVRIDSMHLALVAGGLYVLRHQHQSRRGVALAATLLALAFWTKQTAAIFIVAAFVALLLLNARLSWLYLLVVGLIAGAGSLLLDRATDGWFWKIAFGMHQRHDLYWQRIVYETQWAMFRQAPLLVAGPLVWLVVAALSRRAGTGPLYWALMVLAGIEASAIAFSTQWAEKNATMPGFYLAGLFLGAGAADLCARTERRSRVAFATTLLVSLAVGAQLVVLAYKPSRFVPSPQQHAVAKALLARLHRLAQEGELLVPYHPYYAVLAGRRPTFHQMGVNDVMRAGYPVPRGIRESLAKNRFAAVILDKPPDLLRYGAPLRAYDRFNLGATESPQTLHGFSTRPRYMFVPKVH